MSKILQSIVKNLPFAGIIIFNVLANSARFSAEPLKPYLVALCVVLGLNLVLAAWKGIATYFMVGISGTVLLGAIAVFFTPALGQLFLEHVIPSLYIALFSVTFFPPLFGISPFTYEYSKKDYPKAIWPTRQFKVINLILNYIWAGIFAGVFVLSLIQYSDSSLTQQLLQNIIPIAILLGIGYPLTKKLPDYLQQVLYLGPIRFSSIEDMFAALPHGLNKKKAEGIDAVIQFNLSGEENENGYLTIQNQTCGYTFGKHPGPTMTINAPGQVWLDITNGDLAGDKALLEGMYTVEGDASLLLNFADLFSSEKTPAPEKVVDKIVNKQSLEFKYGGLLPGSVKKVLVIDGGGRNAKYSKSTMMTLKFCEGIEAAGGEVETIHLRKLTINNCTGCYNCWTKTPGVCRYKDDMPELLEKSRKADLIVYVSPLFVFSITSRLKAFLDRSIPNLKPYMLEKEGLTTHPDRYPEDRNQAFVIFSAGGFPEVEGNFDGISNIFRSISLHSENSSLAGEFFLPAAEMLSQPVFRQRRQMVEDTCYQAGKEMVESGKIDPQLMARIQDPGVPQEQFRTQADFFWQSLDGKKSFYKGTVQL